MIKPDQDKMFGKLASLSYPTARHPRIYWVLREVLGWSAEYISTITEQDFDQDGFTVFVTDIKTGKRKVDQETGRLMVTKVPWTTDEVEKLEEWWDLMHLWELP